MILLWLLIGLLPPTLTGWLLLRLLEGRTPVLFSAERWILGFVLGITLTMFMTFCANVTHIIVFTRWGFASVQITLTVILGIARLLQWKLTPHLNLNINPNPNPPLRPLWKIILALALLWTLFKILSGTLILASTPAYFDDTLKNWNLRAKIFVQTGSLDAIPDAVGNVSPLAGYPPTVSLTKAWLSALSGGWEEGIINSIHVLWFLAALLLVYYGLRRRTSWPWALSGSLFLASLPLYFFHGVNAYADVFVSAHLFAAVNLLWVALTEHDARRRLSFFRLSALAGTLLIFTKNEALVLYLPLLLAILITGVVFLLRSGRLNMRNATEILTWYAGWIVLIALPWLVYKWTHGLTFGNAKAVSGTVMGWQPGVLRTFGINIFFEGNWHLLFPVLLLLIFTRAKTALQSSLASLLIFVVAALTMQLLLFLFTSLSAEALRQTGIGRGFVQLAPLIVMLIILWVREVFAE